MPPSTTLEVVKGILCRFQYVKSWYYSGMVPETKTWHGRFTGAGAYKYSVRLIAVTVLSLKVKLGRWHAMCPVFLYRTSMVHMSTGLITVHHRVPEMHTTDMILMLNTLVLYTPQS